MKFIPSFLIAMGLSLGSVQADADPQVTPFAGMRAWQRDHDQRVKWFKDAKFGMFIHWGLYSAAGGYWPPDPEKGKRYEQHYSEWIRTWASVPEPEYGKSLKPLFAPEPGCTDAWAQLAKDAGMRYAVITTKHHEGYTLFNSKAGYSVKNPVTGGTNISPAGRDLFGEYAESFRKQGLVPGAYYSLIDWQFPNPSGYQPYLQQHLSELASNYGPIGVLWVDYSSAGSEGSHWGTRSILETWRQKQPQAIFNNRFWNGLENRNGDFFTPEKYVPPTGYSDGVFEVCHTLNESFGYSYHDQKWKAPKEVIHLLSEIVGKGGNLLLNMGPDAKGHIPDASAATLRGVGKWLETHGEAIYGTMAGPFRVLPFKGNATVANREGKYTLYCHLREWPADGILSLSGLTTPAVSASLLGSSPVELKLTQDASPSVLLPAVNPDPSDPLPVIAITLTGEPKVDPTPYVRQASDRSVTLSASQALLAATPSETSIRLEGDHVGWWISPSDSVWFSFLMTNPQAVKHTGGTAEQVPGGYRVVIEAASPAGAGGECEIRLLDQTLRFKPQETPSWKDYKSMTAGTITLSQPGLLTLHIRPIEIVGQGLMNLRSVRLVPVE